MVAESTQQCYVPRNILITGGAGFIASHIAVDLALKYPEYEVSGCPLRFSNTGAKQHLSPFQVAGVLDVVVPRSHTAWRDTRVMLHALPSRPEGAPLTFWARASLLSLMPEQLRTCLMQIHVFDKLDYCGTLKNLDALANAPNFQVNLMKTGLVACYCLQPVLKV